MGVFDLKSHCVNGRGLVSFMHKRGCDLKNPTEQPSESWHFEEGDRVAVMLQNKRRGATHSSEQQQQWAKCE